MTYTEMLAAEAALNAAIRPAKKQRGATVAQLAHRARMLAARRPCVCCGEALGSHSTEQMLACANSRS